MSGMSGVLLWSTFSLSRKGVIITQLKRRLSHQRGATDGGVIGNSVLLVILKFSLSRKGVIITQP